MRALMEARYPVYAEADIVVESRDVARDVIASDVVNAIAAHFGYSPGIFTAGASAAQNIP